MDDFSWFLLILLILSVVKMIAIDFENKLLKKTERERQQKEDDFDLGGEG